MKLRLILFGMIVSLVGVSQVGHNFILNLGSGNSFLKELEPDASGNLLWDTERDLIFSVEVGYIVTLKCHALSSSFGWITTPFGYPGEFWNPSLNYAYCIEKEPYSIYPFIGGSGFFNERIDIAGNRVKRHMYSANCGITLRRGIFSLSYQLQMILDDFSNVPYSRPDSGNTRRLSNFKIGIVVPLKKE